MQYRSFFICTPQPIICEYEAKKARIFPPLVHWTTMYRHDEYALRASWPMKLLLLYRLSFSPQNEYEMIDDRVA